LRSECKRGFFMVNDRRTKIAVLSIGDELMYGEIADTNFAHIAARLYSCGLPVERHPTVGDDAEAIASELRGLIAAADAVIITGGLGPTSDDRTAAAAADAFSRPLQLNREALAHIKRFAGRHGGEISTADEKQAHIPAGADLIHNPTGTASGFIIPADACRFFFLPGVPREMTLMLEETVLPALLALQEDTRICRTKVLNVFGPSEAEVGTLLEELASPADGVSVAFCVEFPVIQVKLRAEGEDAAAVANSLVTAAERARALLDDWVFAEDDDTIDTVVAGLLQEKGLTLAFAESCTGGLLAKRITDVSGSSAYFLEGAVTYSDSSKIRYLNVPESLLEKKGAVSSEVAAAMAVGVRNASGSDIALSVTGIAGPDGGTQEKPVGTVFISLADHDTCETRNFLFNGDREAIRTITAFSALDWLRRHLLAR
jgi:nicotinamide-nucleotide amidase